MKTTPTPKPNKTLKMRKSNTVLAKAAIAKEIMKGIMARSREFFLPILSAANPAKNGPMAAPIGRRDPIHDSSEAVRWVSRGLSDAFSFGISGEVQPKEIPHV